MNLNIISLLIVYKITITCVNVINALELTIKNDEDDFINISDVIYDNQIDDELILNFVDSYYDMTKVSNSFDISVFVDVTIKGNTNGTIFDYKNSFVKGISVDYPYPGQTLKFENIIIQNFGNTEFDDEYGAIEIFAFFNDFNFITDNCTFRDNYNVGILFFILDPCIFYGDCEPIDDLMKNEPFAFINNNTFYNNKVSIFLYNIFVQNTKDITIMISNSTFEKNVRNFHSDFGSKIIFYQCHFKEIMNNYGSTKSSLLSSGGYDTLILENSLIENVNIKTNAPLIDSNSLTLEILNTTFLNCNTHYGYLININENMNSNVQFEDNMGYITVKDSKFINTYNIFNGKYCNVNIKDSIFQDIDKNIPKYPVIADNTDSTISITNTVFTNLKLSSKLFNDKSTITFNNVKLDDITTNSESLLIFSKENNKIESMTVQNIKCTGDSGNSAFILFDSGELYKNLTIENLHVIDSISNGAFIKIIGNTNYITFNNFTFQSNKSYGPIISNESINSNMKINNSKFLDNINNNKLDSGITHFCNNINLSIENTKFNSNKSKNVGGAICFENISNLEFSLLDSDFIKNEALHGGAIYFGDKSNLSNTKSQDIKITMKNNNFMDNIADLFGGAIYSEFKTVNTFIEENNKISNNKAGITGGGLYISKLDNEKSLIFNNSEIVDNTSNDFTNNYSTNPSYIKLDTSFERNKISLYSGDYLPLTFTLYDDYDQVVKDLSEYYSYITLMVTLKEKYNENNVNFKLTGNSGNLLRGQFKLNNLRIIADSNDYILSISINNYEKEIKMDIPEIEVIIKNDCSSTSIKRYDKNGILYCEEPKCLDSCPINSTAECVAYDRELNKNDQRLNKCVCLPGWTNDKCNEKVFVNLDDLNPYIKAMVVPIVTVLFYLIFIIINRKEGIINDTGFNRILLFSFSIMVFYISVFFITYDDYTNCSLNFLFKNVSISTVIYVFYTYISQGFILGFKVFSNEKNKHGFLTGTPSLDAEPDENEDEDNGNLKSSENENNFKTRIQSVLIQNYYGSVNVSKTNQESMEWFDGIIRKSENRANSDLKEAIIIYIVYLISVIFVVIFYKIRDSKTKDDNIAKDKNGEWCYKCNLEQVDLVYNLIDVMALFIIFLIGRKTIKNECIFNCLKYIFYSFYVLITMGPTVNIISHVFLNDQKRAKVTFDLILNSICYIVIFGLFSWDKLYYIIINKGNDSTVYFKYKNLNKVNLTRENFLKIYKRSANISSLTSSTTSTTGEKKIIN